MTRAELLEALGSLYTREFGDWVLTVHHTLTEPTCPTACVNLENQPSHRPGFGGFVAFGDTVDSAIDEALRMSYDVLIERKPFEPGVPWTNKGDELFLVKMIAALDARKQRETMR